MSHLRREVRALLAAAALCLFWSGTACRKPGAERSHAGAGEGQAGAAPAPVVVLRVETASYSVNDLEKYLTLNAGEDWKSLAAQALSRLFDNFVQEKILLFQARQRNLDLSEDERKSYLEKLKSASAAEAAPSVPIDESAIADKLLVEKYLAALLGTLTVEDEAVAAYYDAHKSEFLQPERVQVSQILLETESQATALLNKIKNASEAEFRAAAQAESSGAKAMGGGVLGVFRAGQLPPDLEKVIFALKPGEVSRVVESSFGFHIFRLDKRFEPLLQTLADAAPSIRSRLLNEKSESTISAHIEELKATIDWKAETDKLPFPYQRIES